MKEHERKGLLERIDRDGATVGATIPDQITIDGESVELRQLIFELNSLEEPIADERITAVQKRLRAERRRREERIEAGTVNLSRGEADAQAIIGIDRALTVLDNLDEDSIEDTIQNKAVADQRRWLNFIEQVLGDDDQRSLDS